MNDCTTSTSIENVNENQNQSQSKSKSTSTSSKSKSKSASAENEQAPVLDLASLNLKLVGSTRTLFHVLFFTATWCAPCARLHPAFAGLEARCAASRPDINFSVPPAPQPPLPTCVACQHLWSSTNAVSCSVAPKELPIGVQLVVWPLCFAEHADCPTSDHRPDQQ